MSNYERMIQSLQAEISAAADGVAKFGNSLAADPLMSWHALEWAMSAFRDSAVVRANSVVVEILTTQGVDAALTFCLNNSLDAASNPYVGSSACKGVITTEINSAYARLAKRLMAHKEHASPKAA